MLPAMLVLVLGAAPDPPPAAPPPNRSIEVGLDLGETLWWSGLSGDPHFPIDLRIGIDERWSVLGRLAVDVWHSDLSGGGVTTDLGLGGRYQFVDWFWAGALVQGLSFTLPQAEFRSYLVPYLGAGVDLAAGPVIFSPHVWFTVLFGLGGAPFVRPGLTVSWRF